MHAKHPTLRLAVAALTVLSFAAASCGDDDEETTASTPSATEPVATMAPEPDVTAPATTPVTEPSSATEGELVGLFSLTAGDCADGVVAGSWFQMVNPGGNAVAGPFVPNGDSACVDTNYTLLTPGADGGLLTDTVQVAPDPAFDGDGNGLAGDIFMPVPFFGVAFAGAFDSAGTAPMVTATGGELVSDLSAFSAYYGGGTFSQGGAATGTIDPETGAYVLEWTSLISGGGFDGFTGVWHFEGTFTPAG